MGGIGRRFAPLLAVAAVMAVLPWLLPSAFYLRVLALIWISGLAALGLNILMGFAGQVSLGHAAFFAIGAYAVAIGPARLDLPPVAALASGLVLAAATAWLIGRPILRLQGIYLAIATLGLGFVTALVLNNETAWTGGPDGMPVAKLALFGWRPRGGLAWYWLTGTALLAGIYGALNLRSSPLGRAMRATRDSEVAAALAGIDVARTKLAAFVVAAVYAALAGALQSAMNGFVTPDVASILFSIELLTMVVLGGLGSVLGSLVGAALIVSLPQALSVLADGQQALIGLVIILVTLFLPEGIVPGLHARLGRAAARAAT